MDQVELWTALGVVGIFSGQLLIARPPFLFGGHDEEWDTERITGVLCAFAASFSRSVGFLIIT